MKTEHRCQRINSYEGRNANIVPISKRISKFKKSPLVLPNGPFNITQERLGWLVFVPTTIPPAG